MLGTVGCCANGTGWGDGCLGRTGDERCPRVPTETDCGPLKMLTVDGAWLEGKLDQLMRCCRKGEEADCCRMGEEVDRRCDTWGDLHCNIVIEDPSSGAACRVTLLPPMIEVRPGGSSSGAACKVTLLPPVLEVRPGSAAP